MSLAAGWVAGEADRPGLEGFSGGALVGDRFAGVPTPDAADGGGLGRGFRVASDALAVLVGERQAAGDVGVAGDRVATLVVLPVVGGAERDHRFAVRGAAVAPVLNVVVLEEPGDGAAGIAAAAVAVFHQAAGPKRHDPL